MTFRLQVFLLVMLVTVTAIAATAWLTLSLTSREYEQAQRDATRHQTEIVDAVQRYGLLRGGWPGVDALVSNLSASTRLHIQLRTEDGFVLADSDTIEGRDAGPVSNAGVSVDPRPQLDPAIARAATADVPVTGPVVPRELFGATPADRLRGSPPALMVRQVAQYRAALEAARCAADAESRIGTEPLNTQPPYLSMELRTRYPECTTRAERTVLTDTAWLNGLWESYRECVGPEGQNDNAASCLYTTFTRGVTAGAAVPLQLYLGAKAGTGVGDLGRPAAFGAAGLIVAAALGTALIARRVSQPVHRLTEASHRLAEGRLDVRVPAAGSSELARLSASFNAMAEAVQRSEERQRRLVADVAHELRTPLSNLRGYLEGLSDGVVEPSRELFASLHEETLLQNRILDDLQVLALAEVGDLKYTRTPTDLAELATGAATAHRAVAAEAGLELLDDATGPAPVDADPDRLRQVLGNLLTNAIRYTDPGGTVRVTVRTEGEEVVLKVRDTGVGITAHDLPRVFDRFWRADPARQRATGGTGLGLTIAHQIVTDHGGRIEVESQPHLGTTFTVRLPHRP